MTEVTRQPPALAVWLLERCLPSGAMRDAVVGDLVEEFGDRNESSLWFWRQSVGLALRYSWFRTSNLVARVTGRPGWADGTPHRRTGRSQPLRQAWRSLARAPAFSAATVATLGLAIAAVATVGTVVEEVLLDELPYQDPEELLILWGSMPGRQLDRARFSGPDASYLIEHTTSLAEMAPMFSASSNLIGPGGPSGVVIGWSTPNLFDLLGVKALVGRTFIPSDTVRIDAGIFAGDSVIPAPMAAVISERLWYGVFHADSSVVGSTIEANGQAFRIIGVVPRSARLVLPAGLELLTTVDLWTIWPFPLDEMAPGPGGAIAIMARRGSASSLAEVAGELHQVARAYRSGRSDYRSVGWTVTAEALHPATTAHLRRPLLILSVAVGLVVLAAMVNVAGLVIARAAARESELAVRIAMGGTRGTIWRETFRESSLLSLAGTVLGVVLASAAVEAIRQFGPGVIPQLDRIAVDGLVLTGTAGLAGLMALLIGLAPAMLISHRNPGTLLSRQSTGHAPRARLRRALVVAQVALAVVLLAGGLASLQTVADFLRAESGIETEDVVVLDLALPYFSYPQATQRADFFEALLDSLAALPQVAAVGGITPVPFDDSSSATLGPFATPDDPELWQSTVADYRPSLPGIFAALGIEIVDGRPIQRSDNQAGAAPVVVIDRRLADSLWPGGTAVGQELLVVGPHFGLESAGPTRATVVGVAETARLLDPLEQVTPVIYLAHRFWAEERMGFAVKTTAAKSDIHRSFVAAVHQLDPTLPVPITKSLGSYRTTAARPGSLLVAVLAAFAASALVLVAVGLYGVLSYSVRRRSHELGVRLALGAEARRLVRLVLAEGLGMTALGLALGLALAVLTLLYLAPGPATGQATELGLYGSIAGVILAVGLAASMIPALQAIKLDPVATLKSQ